jgi:hypothetical protein
MSLYTWHPLNMRLGGPQKRSLRFEKNYLLCLSDIEGWFLCRQKSIPITVPATLTQIAVVHLNWKLQRKKTCPLFGCWCYGTDDTNRHERHKRSFSSLLSRRDKCKVDLDSKIHVSAGNERLNFQLMSSRFTKLTFSKLMQFFFEVQPKLSPIWN